MRKLSYFVACSLDGYIATTDRRVDWLAHEGDYGYSEFLEGVDVILIGRTTYDLAFLLSGKWLMPGKKAWVFSTTRTDSPFKEVSFAQGDALAFVKKLKAKKGKKKIWLVGGSNLAGQVMEEVDELVVTIHPVTLGEGVPLFSKRDVRIHWRLRSTNSWPNGLVQLTYDRAGL
ncbi:MAG TPA: dihydrofolate reductase family protein [Planctomycetota bacterium]